MRQIIATALEMFLVLLGFWVVLLSSCLEIQLYFPPVY
jgi:hypothetical protein